MRNCDKHTGTLRRRQNWNELLSGNLDCHMEIEHDGSSRESVSCNKPQTATPI